MLEPMDGPGSLGQGPVSPGKSEERQSLAPGPGDRRAAEVVAARPWQVWLGFP